MTCHRNYWGAVMLLGLVASQLVPTGPLPAADQPGDLAARAKQTMRRAATYYRTQVATHGGYVYHYTPDLKTRWGEGLATVDQIWVQPPGTPTVGLAFLRAYEATGDQFYLDAATDAALALVYGQLESGGWTNSVDFNPRGDDVAQYRNGRGKGKNNSTLDDGITQGALRLLMHVDRAHEFRHAEIHEAARIALDALLAAQFPNGGFPQVWTGPVEPQPIVKANFPEYDWRTEGRIKEYWTMYTLNDGLAGTVATTLIDAAKIYRDKPCADAAKRLGDFLILAQLPEPQPAWAQQYNYAMQPIWARRFEPPAVTGGESQDAIETLMTIYRVTGDEKYLQPIPAALAYLRKSLLDDGRLARYYELQTNKPLYMNRNGRDYYLTHDDRNLPDHYGWKIDSRLDELAAAYERCRAGDRTTPELSQSALEQQVRTIIADLDDQDRWMSVHDGERLIGQPKFAVGDRYLSSQLFSDNLETLSRFLKP